MDTKNFSQLQETEKEEMIKKIQQEIENLEKKEKLNQQQKERLSFLLSQLRELNDIPEFDVKTGWENFKRDYLPIAEEFLNRERERKQKKKMIFKNMMSISFVLVFMFVFVGGATGRTGFVNYFTRNTQETETISDKSTEQIQDEIEKEYITLEKEYGIKIGKLNLDANKYLLQDCTISKKYVNVEYLNINTEENIVFSIYKNKQTSGKINVETSKTTETYLYEEVEYIITKNVKRYDISWEKEGIYYILQNCSSSEECKNIIENIRY